MPLTLVNFTPCFRTVRWRRSAHPPPQPPPSPPRSLSLPVPSALVSPCPPPSPHSPLEQQGEQEEAFSALGGGSPWPWSFTADPLALLPALLHLPHPPLHPRYPPGSKVRPVSEFCVFYFDTDKGSRPFCSNKGWNCKQKSALHLCSPSSCSSHSSSSPTSCWRRWSGWWRGGRGGGLLPPDRKQKVNTSHSHRHSTKEELLWVQQTW